MIPRDFAQRALEVLESIEWEGGDADGARVCPRCGESAPQGHDRGCKLAALIAELREVAK